MNQVLDMFGAMTLVPLMYSQALFTQALQWQREQADALTKLMASVTGQESFGSGTVRRKPEDADLFVGKSVSHTKTQTDMHTLFLGLLAELTPWCVYLHQEMEFTAPVRSGDVITATGTIEEIDAKGNVRVALN